MSREPSRVVSAVAVLVLLVVDRQLSPVEAFAHTGKSLLYLPPSNKSTTTRLAAKKRPGNPLQTLLGDMASSLSSSISGGGANSNIDFLEMDQKLNQISIPSWERIRSDLEAKQTSEEKAFRSNVEKGIGAPSPLNKIRLYDESNTEKDIRVTFYRDSASWCPCKCFFCASRIFS